MIHRHSRYAAFLLLAAGFSAQAATCPRTSIEPVSAPATGIVGIDYIQTFTATNTNASPFTWAITSGLPNGLSIKATTGEVTGRPSQAGNYLFTVTATDASGCSGGRTYPLAVASGDQTIAFTTTAPVGAQIGGSYEVGAIATSGLPVTFAIDAAAASICSIAGTTVTFNAIGNCTIDANQAGDANWHAAPKAQQVFGIGKTDQTISFTSTAPANAAVAGAAYGVAATATSGLAVTFSIDAGSTGMCAIAGSSVTFQAAGTCTINANQAGDTTYSPAPQVQQSFAVGKGDQAITFTSTAPAAAVVAGTAYSVAATSNSGLAVSFAVDAASSSICVLTGASVTFIGAGTCTINANQAGNANWNAAPQVQQSFAVGKGSQAITFVSPAPPATVAGTAYVVSATATSLLTVTYAIDPSASAVCSLLANTVTFTGAGTCVINANQAGDANWNPAPQAQQSFAVGKGDQGITFTSTAPAAATVGGPAYTVTATSSSGLPVTFAIDPAASAVCTIAGSAVSFIANGNCIVTANQAGNANWNAAPPVQQTFGVGKGPQTITYTSTAPAAAVVGGPAYTVTATSSAGLPVAFAIDPTASGVCTIAGSTVSFIGAGTCVIDANQAGNANYNAAPQVQQTFAVGKGSQTITYTSTAPAAAVVGGPAYTVTATSSAGLPVTFAIDPIASGVCTIAGSTVSFVSAGMCVINANQAGNANYNAAPQVQQTFAVGKGSQTITYTSTAPAAKVGGATYTVTATATSGLAVTYAINAVSAGICTIAGSTVSFTAAGTCVINANQPGNANWNAATQAQQNVTVGKGDPIITFTTAAPIGAAVGGPTYTVGATSSAGLPVTFAIDASTAANCSVAGSVVQPQHPGNCTVNANQAGDANWNPAQAQQTFGIAMGMDFVQFTSATPTDARYLGPSYTVSATSTSGRPVTFSIDPANTACALSGADTVNFIGVGTCDIIAEVSGGTDWGSAQSQMSFAVGKASQTVTFTTGVPTVATIGHTYTPAATATSGLPVTFSIDSPGGVVSCTVDAGGVVTFVAAGTCIVVADQAGDANWDAAAPVQQSFEVTACVTLAPGEVLKGEMPGSASFCIDNTSGAAQEFTYLPINNNANAIATLNLVVDGLQAVAGPPLPRPAGSDAGPALAPLQDAIGETASGAHPDFPAFPADHKITASDLIAQPKSQGTKVIPPGPLTVGQLIDLNAALSGCSGTLDMRKARVEYITTPQSAGQQVLYAVQEVVETTPGAGDWHPPVIGGYTTLDFANIVDSIVQAPPGGTPVGSTGTSTQLKTGGLDLITTNFGTPTDLDNNGGVIVFFTPAINALSPPASSVVVQGTFLSRDLFSSAPGSCPRSNEGEILYMIVPDPTGSINSNVRTWSSVYGTAPTTIIHHLSHLTNASRRLYITGAPALEEQWLDEGLSWIMQELVFFNTSVGIAPRSNAQLSTLTTGPNASVRVQAFNTFENTLYGSLRGFFYQLGSSNASRRFGPLRTTVQGTATSHEVVQQNFSTAALFLRYVLDRKNTGDTAILNTIANSTLTGRANLQAALNVNLDDWVRDFLVAAYADDAVAGVAPEYTLPSWNYRSVYGGLGGFPMAVDALSANPSTLAPALGPGGGTRYVRFGIAAGGTATVTLTQGGVAPGTDITMAIVRTK